MFETDVIFNDIKSLITTEVTVEEPKRGNMDYLFWIICDDNSIPKLKRFLSVHPDCIFSEPFESEELLKEIRESERERWMKFIGVDFKNMSTRRLLHFRENVLNIIGHGKSNFIIKWWADYDDKYKMRAGGNLKEFCNFILNLTKSETERRLADIRTDIVKMLSDRMFDDIKTVCLEDDFFDLTKYSKDLTIRLDKDRGSWFNVYKDNLNTLIETDDITGLFTIYKCAFKYFSNGRFDIIMILRKDYHGPSRVILKKTFNNLDVFYGSSYFELKNIINWALIKDEEFKRLYKIILNANEK